MKKTLTDSEVFQLAGYAHAKLAPLIAEAQTIEPSIEFRIELNFANSEVKFGEGHIDVHAHWARDGMFLHSTWHQIEWDIDELAADIKNDIEKLRADA